MSTNNKTSIVVGKQLPQFIQEDNPLFVRFLEAYYEFLENKQTGQTNDLITEAQKLRYVKDVDASVDEFHDQFNNDFATLIPKDNNVDPAFLLKNIMPLYKSKGSSNSFRYLFNLLYGKDIELLSPRNSVLRASDGKWIIENILRATTTIYSEHTVTSSLFVYLPQQCLKTDISVYVNGVLLDPQYYYCEKEYYKLVFTAASSPTYIQPGYKIDVYYNVEFNLDVLKNRKITGITSKATALIEDSNYSFFNYNKTVELTILEKTKSGDFVTAELLHADVIGSDGNLIDIYLSGLSLLTITLTYGGSSYNVGDSVTVTGGNFTTPAIVKIGETYSGGIDNISILFGGAGFMTYDDLFIDGVANTAFKVVVSNIDSSGSKSANTLTLSTDIIANSASINISNTLFVNTSSNLAVFPANTIANATSTLANCFKNVTYNVGPIANITIFISTTNYIVQPLIQVAGNNSVHVPFQGLGILGRFDYNNVGTNYAVGDEVTITNAPCTMGIGAAARVASVNTSNSNSIVRVDFEPARITGTANTNGSIFIIGTGTAFTTELKVGDQVMINGESRYINSISSATAANVNVAFSSTSTSKKVGKYGTYIIGGQGYANTNFPSVSISSAAGTGANLTIRCLMGDGEQFSSSANTLPGQIKSLSIISQGTGYKNAPLLSFLSIGDGTATATAQIISSYTKLKGRYAKSDGILSDNSIKLQEGIIYHDFSYLIKSKVLFDSYKQTLKTLAHPAGFSMFGRYLIDSQLSETTTSANVTLKKTVSGKVSVTNNSIYVTGTNTKFNVANSLGIMTVGSRISVNNQIRVVNSFISNTNISVTTVFTANASGVGIIVL